MGLLLSCPFSTYIDLEALLKSICLEDGEVKSPIRSISFKSRYCEPAIMQLVGSQKMRVEGSVSFKVSSAEEKGFNYAKKKEMCIESTGLDNMMDEFSQLSIFDPRSPKHEAALKLQKVYKSFRTRRKLADCAVLIEQSWWKLLDFAELKRSSISYFNIDKHETAVSRWSRARTRAAKVGKGLLKNGKAQKLALQHWLEAIDPRHRYGHNLHFYYGKWLHSQSKEPFFYWLDIGEGKEVNLVEKCPRSKLQQQCIKYLGPIERKAYEVLIEDGKILCEQTGEHIDTTGEPKGAKWIFVLSTSRTLYVGIKKKGSFQHSSFLAGGATLAAGRIVAEKGVIKAIWPHSGHYRPTLENFQDFVSFLHENDVDTTYVKMDSNDDDDDKKSFGKQSSSVHIRTHSSEEDMAEDHPSEEANVTKQHSNLPLESPQKTMLFCGFSTKLSTLQIPNNDYLFIQLKTEDQETESGPKEFMSDDEEDEPNLEKKIQKKSIFQRINIHNESNSFQLGQNLSFKWSTGAGPRIGCLRDYPTELQSHTLEQANLSPRSAPGSSHRYDNKVLCTSPKSFENMSFLRRNRMNLIRTGELTELLD